MYGCMKTHTYAHLRLYLYTHTFQCAYIYMYIDILAYKHIVSLGSTSESAKLGKIVRNVPKNHVTLLMSELCIGCWMLYSRSALLRGAQKRDLFVFPHKCLEGFWRNQFGSIWFGRAPNFSGFCRQDWSYISYCVIQNKWWHPCCCFHENYGSAPESFVLRFEFVNLVQKWK